MGVFGHLGLSMENHNYRPLFVLTFRGRDNKICKGIRIIKYVSILFEADEILIDSGKTMCYRFIFLIYFSYLLEFSDRDRYKNNYHTERNTNEVMF